MKRILLSGLAVLFSGFVSAQHGPAVVASTAWVAAFARAAGGAQVAVIAPAGLAHPPDYDPRPSDLLSVSRADLVLVGGYEAFLQRLRDALGAKARLLTVVTTYDPQAVRKEVGAIAAVLGTRAEAAAFSDRYDAAWRTSAGRLQLRTGARRPVVVVQRFMVPWVQLLGVEAVGTFGPGPLSLDDLRRLKALAPTLIIDNAHAAPAATLAEVAGARRVALVNFPEAGEGLLDVLKRNTDLLEGSLAP